MIIGANEVEVAISPGEARALAWVAAQHPNSRQHCRTVTDLAGAGWIVSRVYAPLRGSTRMAEYEYWLSPTGRVYRGIAGKRTQDELRNADYDR